MNKGYYPAQTAGSSRVLGCGHLGMTNRYSCKTKHFIGLKRLNFTTKGFRPKALSHLTVCPGNTWIYLSLTAIQKQSPRGEGWKTIDAKGGSSMTKAEFYLLEFAGAE